MQVGHKPLEGLTYSMFILFGALIQPYRNLASLLTERDEYTCEKTNPQLEQLEK